MRIAFLVALFAVVSPAVHDLSAVYAVAGDIEEYRAAHHRLPELKNVEDYLRIVGASHPRFGIADHRNNKLLVESDPVRNTYTVAAGDDVVIRDGKVIRSPEVSGDAGLDEVRARFASLVSADPKSLKASRLKGLLDEAHDAVVAGAAGVAVAKYEEAVQLDPSFVDADMLGFIAGSLTTAGFPPPPPRPPGAKERPTIQNDAAMRDAAKKILPRLRAAVDARPDDYSLTASLAGLQSELGDRAASRATIDRYAKAHPADLRGHLLRLRVSKQPGDVDAAARALDATVASAANDAGALYTAGVLGYEMAKEAELRSAARAAILRDARQLLDRAIAVKPDNFEAMTYLNLVLREQATAESDPAKQKALIDEADRVRSKAVEIIRRKKGS